MNQDQATIKAKALNSMVKGAISYMAHPIEKTKWEKDRWCVAECYGDKQYPLNVVGIAAL